MCKDMFKKKKLQVVLADLKNVSSAEKIMGVFLYQHMVACTLFGVKSTEACLARLLFVTINVTVPFDIAHLS